MELMLIIKMLAIHLLLFIKAYFVLRKQIPRISKKMKKCKQISSLLHTRRMTSASTLHVEICVQRHPEGASVFNTSPVRVLHTESSDDISERERERARES